MALSMDEFMQKYYVHPETLAFIQARVADNVKPYYEIGVHEARKASIAAAEKYTQRIDFNGTETEITVPSPFDKGMWSGTYHIFIFVQKSKLAFGKGTVCGKKSFFLHICI